MPFGLVFGLFIRLFSSMVLGGGVMKFQRIEDLRVDHDLTIRQVAEVLGCHRDVYSRYEQGIRQIPLDLAIRLAEFYDCSLDYLLGITNVKRRFGN